MSGHIFKVRFQIVRQGGTQKRQKGQKSQKFLALLPFLPFLPFLYSNFISVKEASFVRVSRHQVISYES
ncbi:MAG: hypothetical protein L0220_01260, partial [Acidobacteria bacterium]|nr:hypothetical protein [Acidobacteriota bacterium]